MDIASNKITEEIDWFEMKPGDVYINPGVHVVLFRMKSDMFWRKIYIAESNSTIALNKFNALKILKNKAIYQLPINYFF